MTMSIRRLVLETAQDLLTEPHLSVRRAADLLESVAQFGYLAAKLRGRGAEATPEVLEDIQELLWESVAQQD